MGTQKKGVLIRSTEWANHLRHWGKRIFWSKHRIKEKKLIKTQKDDFR